MIRIFMTLFFSGLSFLGITQKNVYSDQQIISVYSQVGEIHNKGLDVVLSNFQKDFGSAYRGGNTLADRNKMYQKSDELIRNFVSTELQVTDIDVNQFLNHHVETKNIFGKDLVTALGLMREGRSLSPVFMDAMKELNAVMDNDMTCVDQNAYNRIVSSYIGRLSSFKEKAYLVSAASIGFKSSVYWQENYFKWKSSFVGDEHSKTSAASAGFLFASSSGLPVSSGDRNYYRGARSIAKADVTGIVTGGIGGCAYGAVGGTVTFPVVGTIAGCLGVGAVSAVTGGLSGSITAAVSVFFGWIFG